MKYSLRPFHFENVAINEFVQDYNPDGIAGGDIQLSQLQVYKVAGHDRNHVPLTRELIVGCTPGDLETLIIFLHI